MLKGVSVRGSNAYVKIVEVKWRVFDTARGVHAF
jgi:hypothetical protein